MLPLSSPFSRCSVWRLAFSFPVRSAILALVMRNRKVLDECNEQRVGGHTTYSYPVRHNANEMDDVLPFDFDEILQCILQETHDLEF